MKNKSKLSYICRFDRCVYKQYVSSDVWFCPFIGCIYKTDRPLFCKVQRECKEEKMFIILIMNNILFREESEK